MKTRGPGKIREDKSQRGTLATLIRAWYLSHIFPDISVIYAHLSHIFPDISVITLM